MNSSFCGFTSVALVAPVWADVMSVNLVDGTEHIDVRGEGTGDSGDGTTCGGV